METNKRRLEDIRNSSNTRAALSSIPLDSTITQITPFIKQYSSPTALLDFIRDTPTVLLPISDAVFYIILKILYGRYLSSTANDCKFYQNYTYEIEDSSEFVTLEDGEDSIVVVAHADFLKLLRTYGFQSIVLTNTNHKIESLYSVMTLFHKLYSYGFDKTEKELTSFRDNNIESWNNILSLYKNIPLSPEESQVSSIAELCEPFTLHDFNTSENTSRFSGAIWFKEIQDKIVTLAGLGGIGSYVCFLLSRLNLKSLFIYDFDVVEFANMSGQLYNINDVGTSKVAAMTNLCNSYSSYNSVFGLARRFTKDDEASDIMICGFDNMKARATYFNSWSKHVACSTDKSKCLFIDGRLSAECLQVYCITGDDYEAMTKYKKAYFTDENADETICSYKQTSFMANMIGGIIVNLFVNFVANKTAGAPIRELPFFTTYDGSTMEFKIE